VRKFSLILIISVTFIGSCIDPLDLKIDEEVNVLIVEGAITTKPGPYHIRLTRSAKYGSIFDGFLRPVQRARIVIRDSDGNNHKLTESPIGPGVYFTENSFRPVVGKSYTLLITTPNGNEYTSLPEKIYRASEILGLEAEFSKTPVGDNKFITGFDVYARFQDKPNEDNYYMWKNNGTFQIRTFPERYVARGAPGSPAVPMPKPCCAVCWVTERFADRSVQLFSDNNVDGNLVLAPAAFIEDDGLRFGTKYLVRIEQHTLTREAFQFFKLLKDQTSINGDIFDPPPATLRGNMINLTNPDENVIGYFRASDVSVDSMFLTKEMLLAPSPINNINDDCRTYKGGTTQKPKYW
jgi:uncharacterized protein DUF4249